MHATVVIPTLGASAFLQRCLDAVAAQRHPSFDVVVVVNGPRGIEARGAVVAIGTNRGFAVAANAGARLARGAYVAFLNDDAEPEPDWLGESIACLARHPRACAAASRVLRSDDPRVLDGAGDVLTRSLKAYRRGFGESEAGRYLAEEQVFGPSGTAALWRVDAFVALGGFDEAMFAYYEDVDLALRARLRGHECWYAPRAVVRHVGGATAAADWAELAAFHSVVNRWRTIVKSVPGAAFIRLLPAVVAGEAVAAARVAAAGHGSTLLRAYGRVLRSLPAMLALRRAERSARMVGTHTFLRLLEGTFPPLGISVARLVRPHGAHSPA